MPPADYEGSDNEASTSSFLDEMIKFSSYSSSVLESYRRGGCEGAMPAGGIPWIDAQQAPRCFSDKFPVALYLFYPMTRCDIGAT